jgi:hypothetical protein
VSVFEDIVAKGNRSYSPNDGRRPNKVRCVDGFSLSVIAGEGTYCAPRPDRYGGLGDAPGDYPGPYTAVEVGYPSERPEPWDEPGGWRSYAEDGNDPTETVYGYVPVELVRALIAAHGGESS